jgi:hypothetical protein
VACCSTLCRVLATGVSKLGCQCIALFIVSLKANCHASLQSVLLSFFSGWVCTCTWLVCDVSTWCSACRFWIAVVQVGGEALHPASVCRPSNSRLKITTRSLFTSLLPNSCKSCLAPGSYMTSMYLLSWVLATDLLCVLDSYIHHRALQAHLHI